MSSVIFYNGTAPTAGLPVGSRPACALRVHLRNFCLWAGTSVHRLSISWTSTTAIYATSLGFLTSKSLGCEDKMDTGLKASLLQALIIWKLMQ